MHDEDLLRRSFELAIEYLEGLDHRPVGCPVGLAEMLERMGGPLPQQGSGAIQVIEALSAAADRGIVATAGPRYFGFVTGGAHPASVAADWLTSVWDQNAFSYVLSPAAAAAEEVVRLWLTDLFGLSSEMSMGIVTGGTMANFTALAAARHALLKRVGWNVEEDGLFNAPEITVITSDESHITIFAALQMLGLGRNRVQRVATDNQGRMRTDALKEVLAKLETPVLVCAQAGNVNTGAFDPISEIASLVQERNAWLHVDGAFGLWVAASPEYRHLVQGIERANSITVDCHKWLNVPYDSGLVFVNDHSAHQQAMTFNAPYYMPGQIVAREN
ncbi:MAG TPA: aminotransferase class V-fold PLP-dependent enzyme, partial [Blastocatellia bacterium]|nr:aminotransferase class V-fold PLP-dependent enzyme [Blastocatellia bacterium]